MKTRIFLFNVRHKAVDFFGMVEHKAENRPAEVGVAAALPLGRFFQQQHFFGAVFARRYGCGTGGIAATNNNHIIFHYIDS